MNNNLSQSEQDLLKSLGIDETIYFLIDIGANLTNKKFSRDLIGLVQRAKNSG
jgi:hypothetical protein